ncbi:MAG: sigma 54-interacting transcriptional regulator, partial [Myxococcota bacterium]
ERGAFTDAKTQKNGLFELADGGTVLLDEIGDMPLASQAKLLQVLETKTFKRVGGTSDVLVGVRLLAATNRDLLQLVHGGQFRHDLYYRLNIVTLRVPPLRDRVADIPLLIAHFVVTFNDSFRRQVQGPTPRALEAMCRYAWPGNVRELRNAVERAFILDARAWIDLPHLPAELAGDGPGHTPTREDASARASGPLDLQHAEVQLIREALDKAEGNQTRAARLLGISRDTLRYRMRKHGLANGVE